jgi:excisionase family DNA binding protein
MRPLLSVAEVAAYLNVSTKTVRRLIGRGELRSVRIGRSIRIPEEEIECLIAGRSSV